VSTIKVGLNVKLVSRDIFSHYSCCWINWC